VNVDHVAAPERHATLHLPGGRALALGRRPLVMGVVNITPDSFSDGGRYLDPELALARALELIEQGADLLDLGAESTRPGGGVYGTGAAPVDAEAEIDRLLPVLERLRAATGLPLSVDTRKAAVARAALAAGADLINDISALGDPEMGAVVAQAGVPVVVMHSRGNLGDMQVDPNFADPVGEVAAELCVAVARARAAGIAPAHIVVDPGIGFGKRLADNLSLLAGLAAIERATGCPVLVGASRKAFIGTLTGAPTAERLPGSLAAVAWAAQLGAAIVRVHDVAATRAFLDVWRAIAEHQPSAGGSP
jgi:dihydropteroate synthase